VFIFAETVTSLQSETAVRVVPGNMDLTSFIFLTCKFTNYIRLW